MKEQTSPKYYRDGGPSRDQNEHTSFEDINDKDAGNAFQNGFDLNKTGARYLHEALDDEDFGGDDIPENEFLKRDLREEEITAFFCSLLITCYNNDFINYGDRDTNTSKDRQIFRSLQTKQKDKFTKFALNKTIQKYRETPVYVMNIILRVFKYYESNKRYYFRMWGNDTITECLKYYTGSNYIRIQFKKIQDALCNEEYSLYEGLSLNTFFETLIDEDVGMSASFANHAPEHMIGNPIALNTRLPGQQGLAAAKRGKTSEDEFDHAYQRTTSKNYLREKQSEFKKLEKNKIPLTPEERKECIDKKAVWNFHIGKDHKHHPSPAVWKSKDPKTGKVTFVTHTHRAYQTRPTLKGAISIFHSFIKGTA